MCPTPLGNLEDITLRVLRVLREVPVVAAEDTRRTRILLEHYGVRTRVLSFAQHNEEQRLGRLLALLHSGQDVALVSDAGTPGIADPGFSLVSRCWAEEIPVVSLPGPTALVTALVASGLPCDQFLFVGYLPRRAAARRRLLEQLAGEMRTLVCYEAPHRLARSLRDVQEVFGNRMMFLARELTKLHEELLRGTVEEVCRSLGSAPVRGELVLVLAGAAARPPGPSETAESPDGSPTARARQLSRREGISRSEAYRRVLEQKKGTPQGSPTQKS
ncbi:MAG: 16S rRNA (cytidine(1402)-2'-O)-methyltransferase [Thermaerobacter sp.]|nr:16S rRNA (cytidine(1402)-2'-O)-methyltransferase [Thermaerobacter sp.]